MHALGILQGLLGPPRCEGCGVRGDALCPGCREVLARPVENARVAGVDRVLARWAYEGAARNLVLALKLRGIRATATPLVAAMHSEVMATGLAGESVTWVPGRRRDALRRGYDHAEVLAAGLAVALGLPLAALVERTGDRADQTSLGAAARRTNLVGAFRARPCAGRVVLVDDLVTTGATASACARALTVAGAAGVEVVVPCRA